MTYMYNNVKIHDYRSQQRMLARSLEHLKLLQRRIKGWNEILHRKESKDITGPEIDSRLLLDYEDSKQRIINIGEKLDSVIEYPEQALYGVSFLENIYLWCQTSINPIFSMKHSELVEHEKNLKIGYHFFPNPVTVYYLEEYSKDKEKKLQCEVLRYNSLCEKLAAVQENPPEPLPVEGEEQKEEVEKKPPFTAGQLIVQIISSSIKLILSATQGICFIFMIMAHIFNGNILSLLYVLSIFCYGLVIKCRPQRRYWTVLLLYVGIVIALKYLCSFIETLLALQGKGNSIDILQAKVSVEMRVVGMEAGTV